VAAAGAAAATTASERLGAGAFRGFAIGGRGENGKLEAFPGALALRASDNRGLVHDNALIALTAIVAKVFVDGHDMFLAPNIIRIFGLTRKKSESASGSSNEISMYTWKTAG
jgi:hypothetical protein